MSGNVSQFPRSARKQRNARSGNPRQRRLRRLVESERALLPNLKPTTQTISLRLPRHLLDAIKTAANARDVPYQSLIKVWLQERIERADRVSGCRGPDGYGLAKAPGRRAHSSRTTRAHR